MVAFFFKDPPLVFFFALPHRFLRSLYQKVRSLLGHPPPLSESWPESGTGSLPPASTVNWPLLVYGSLVLTAPYLMWRMTSAAAYSSSSSSPEWDPEEEESFVAEASHSFAAATDRELELRAGQRVLVAPRHRQPRVRGWLLCRVGDKEGMVPANHVNIVGRRRPPPQQQQQQQQQQPDVVMASSSPSPGDKEDSDEMENAFK